MDDFLKDFNDNPNKQILDRWCLDAGKRSLHNSAVLFAKAAIDIRQRDNNQDLLPEVAPIYQQLSISGYYCKDPMDKEIGAWAAEELCIDPNVEYIYRFTARKNQVFYIKKLEELVEVKFKKELKYNLPSHWFPMNPSIVNWNNQLWMIQRTVNYRVKEDGNYQVKDDGQIETRNYLVRLDSNLDIVSSAPMLHPDNWGPTIWDYVKGIEDCRLFVKNNELWCSATVREKNIVGLCEMYLFKILDPTSAEPKFEIVSVMQGPEPHRHEKNWMPLTPVTDCGFVYSMEPTVVIGDRQNITTNITPSIAVENFRGGSQVIKFDQGYLAVIHESVEMFDGLRNYVHRFVYLNDKFVLERISPRFKIAGRRIEFVSGIAYHPDSQDLVVSYGLSDRESWLLQLSHESVLRILKPIPRKTRQELQPNGPVV
jgi:hypothetical protein